MVSTSTWFSFSTLSCRTFSLKAMGVEGRTVPNFWVGWL
jgi:hypothetical protein